MRAEKPGACVSLIASREMGEAARSCPHFSLRSDGSAQWILHSHQEAKKKKAPDGPQQRLSGGREKMFLPPSSFISAVHFGKKYMKGSTTRADDTFFHI